MPSRTTQHPNASRSQCQAQNDSDTGRRGWMKWECSVIGSADGVSLQLNSSLVDPLHAAVLRTPEGYQLWDLNSLKGTVLNGTRIIRANLHDGDQITIGPFSLRFVGGGTDAGKIIPNSHRKVVEHQPVPQAGPRFGPVKPQPKLTPYSPEAVAAKLRTAPRADPGSGLANNLAPMRKPYPLPGTAGPRPAAAVATSADERAAMEAEVDRLLAQLAAERRQLTAAQEQIRRQEEKISSQSTQFSQLEEQLGALGQTRWSPAVSEDLSLSRKNRIAPRPAGIPVVPPSAANRRGGK